MVPTYLFTILEKYVLAIPSEYSFLSAFSILFNKVDKPGKLTHLRRMKLTMAKLLDTGEVFDSSELYQTYLYNFIIGFQTALPQLPSGTTVQLYVPSGYGYGNTDIYNDSSGELIIPANSNLVFEITLLDVF